MQGGDQDSDSISMSQDRQNYIPSQQEQQEQVMGMTKKKKKVEDPYKHIFRKKLSLGQQYHEDRIYFKWGPPYPIQLKYMKYVLQTLDEKKHALIQAPTGSGKTLCLLNSAFGWLVNSPKSKSEIVRKVIFTSRSHTQLQQLKKQIQKTCYRPNMVIFAGRNKLCCNQKIDKKDGQDQKIYSQCTKAVQHKRLYNKIKKMTQQQRAKKKITAEYINELQQKMCQYFEDYPDRKTTAYNIFNQLRGEVITIEDEYDINFQKKQCPYYYPSTVKYFPDLILMPYNYVLNKKILQRNQRVIENSILIFDEGHNITQAARNGLTISITLNEIKNMIDLLKKCSEKIEKKFEDFPDPTEENNGSDEQQILQKQNKDNPKIMLKIEKQKNKPEQQNKQKNVKQILLQIQINRKILQQIYDKLKKFQQQNLQPNSKKKIGISRGQNDRNIISTFLKIFFGKQLNQGIQFPKEQIEAEINVLRKIKFSLYQIYKFIDEYSKEQYKPFYLLKFADKIIQIAQIIENQNMLFNYGLFFQWVRYQKQKNKFQHYLEVKFYCFNPKLMFDELKKLPMSMIITSGTLSPMDTWEDQTGVQFKEPPLSVSSDHVILPNQCLTAFMPQYNGKNAFYTTGQNQQNIPFNTKRAMEAIQNICKGTPGGVLVIVPSKDWILQMKKQFPKSNIKKQPFYEQKGNEYMKNIQKFQQIFSAACNTGHGAIIFAKCRGQLTQGIDFKDNMCRSVVIVGYPYPNKSDPYLVGKLDFFDRSMKAGLSSINGDKWMQKQIIRSVNQGIGRVIRHKDDYGMIFLLDVRYKWDKIKKDLSGWALRNTITIKDHDKIQQQCENFFQFHQERQQQNI